MNHIEFEIQIMMMMMIGKQVKTRLNKDKQSYKSFRSFDYFMKTIFEKVKTHVGSRFLVVILVTDLS